MRPHAAILAHQGAVWPVSLDVIFPVLHGTFGEDGTIQGLFELAGIAYVGSGVLGSATGMDKDVMKRLFAAAKLPIPKHVTFLRREWEASAEERSSAEIEAALKYPLFVKPANLGSSVGISKAHDRKELGPAIDLAASYDRKIVVEQGVGGKTRQGARAGSRRARQRQARGFGGRRGRPRQGVLRLRSEIPERGLRPHHPREAHPPQTKQVQQMAIAAFRACDCSGLARVDFLMEPTLNSGKAGRIYLNEINTLPGLYLYQHVP